VVVAEVEKPPRSHLPSDNRLEMIPRNLDSQMHFKVFKHLEVERVRLPKELQLV